VNNSITVLPNPVIHIKLAVQYVHKKHVRTTKRAHAICIVLGFKETLNRSSDKARPDTTSFVDFLHLVLSSAQELPPFFLWLSFSRVVSGQGPKTIDDPDRRIRNNNLPNVVCRRLRFY
jgi:hypothetical protein